MKPKPRSYQKHPLNSFLLSVLALSFAAFALISNPSASIADEDVLTGPTKAVGEGVESYTYSTNDLNVVSGLIQSESWLSGMLGMLYGGDGEEIIGAKPKAEKALAADRERIENQLPLHCVINWQDISEMNDASVSLGAYDEDGNLLASVSSHGFSQEGDSADAVRIALGRFKQDLEELTDEQKSNIRSAASYEISLMVRVWLKQPGVYVCTGGPA